MVADHHRATVQLPTWVLPVTILKPLTTILLYDTTGFDPTVTLRLPRPISTMPNARNNADESRRGTPTVTTATNRAPTESSAPLLRLGA